MSGFAEDWKSPLKQIRQCGVSSGSCKEYNPTDWDWGERWGGCWGKARHSKNLRVQTVDWRADGSFRKFLSWAVRPSVRARVSWKNSAANKDSRCGVGGFFSPLLPTLVSLETQRIHSLSLHFINSSQPALPQLPRPLSRIPWEFGRWAFACPWWAKLA